MCINIYSYTYTYIYTHIHTHTCIVKPSYVTICYISQTTTTVSGTCSYGRPEEFRLFRRVSQGGAHCFRCGRKQHNQTQTIYIYIYIYMYIHIYLFIYSVRGARRMGCLISLSNYGLSEFQATLTCKCLCFRCQTTSELQGREGGAWPTTRAN